MARMTIGEFAGRTRLSPRALRLYDELGLVVPAAVDPGSGYRFYEESQLDRARLVAVLRRLDMPLADIARLAGLDGDAAAGALAQWWGRVEAGVAERRALVGYLQARFKGEGAVMREVQTRSVPERTVASISRHVTLPETGAFFGDAFARLRAVAPGIEGIAGLPYLVFYGEVSEDSDGPLELCRPVARPALGDVPPAGGDIQLRVEAAHDEAYIRLTEAEMSWPALLPLADELERWARDHGVKPGGPLRQVLLADRRTARADTPVCDLSLPLR